MDMNTNNQNIEKKELIDPFVQEESPEAFEKKKEKWLAIFTEFPEFSDIIIEAFESENKEKLRKILKLVIELA